MREEIGRKYLLLIIGIVVCLCACEGKEEKETSTVKIDYKQDTIESSSISEENNIEKNDLVGTYIGEQGSGLTLYKDGTSEYYWQGKIEDGNEWDYKNNVITVTMHLNNFKYSIYANIENKDYSDLVFDSKSLFWDKESFTKTDLNKDKVSIEDYKELLEVKGGLSVENEVEYTTKTIGGIDFSISSNYQEVEDEDFDISYESKAEQKYMGFSCIDVTISDEKLSDFKEDVINKLGEDFSEISEKDIQVAGLFSKEYTFMEESKYGGIQYHMIYVNNKELGKVIFIAFGELENSNYKDDYTKLIETAVLSDKDNERDSSNTNKVDPDLKAFLDSYEIFVDEYIDFMKKYQNSNDTLGMISDYMEFIEKYTDYMEKIEAVDEDSLSTADAKYYLEVTTRCTMKMLELY